MSDGVNKRTMRVAFVAPRLAAAGAVGGAETLLFNLAALADKAGYEVEFLATCAKNHFTWENVIPPGEVIHEGIKVRHFPVDADRDHDLFLKKQMLVAENQPHSDEDEELWIKNSVNSSEMMDYIAGADFDRIVVGPYLFGLTFAVASRFPKKTLLVPCLHDEGFARARRVVRMFHEVRGFFFNTQAEQELAQELYGDDIVREGRPTGVVGFALDEFTASSEEGHRIAGTDDPYIIFCGRREPLKGTPLLVDYWAAFRRLHPESKLKFVFTGTGEINCPEDLEGEIIDCGFVTEEEKHHLMAGALCFCHASMLESLGIVLLESWLAGRPVLVHGYGHVLREQTRLANGGLWFNYFHEFNECLEFMLDNGDVADALAASGRAFTKANYTAEAVTERMIKLLRM